MNKSQKIVIVVLIVVVAVVALAVNANAMGADFGQFIHALGF